MSQSPAVNAVSSEKCTTDKCVVCGSDAVLWSYNRW